jgi:glycosyltransferase involved in cell wall biosynthesis
MTSPISSPSDVAPSGTFRPLRILQVASYFRGWGGTEIHLLNLSEELIRRGHDVTVAVRPGKFVEAEAQKRNLPILSATVERHQDWRDRRIFRQAMKRERYDVVHAHWRPDYLVAPTIARFSGVPAVLLSHHSPYPLKAKEVFYYPRAYSRMIALSESVRQMLIGIGLPPDFVTTVHHGTDVDRFVQITQPPELVREEWNVPEGAFVVGIAGRISAEKGILDLLHAAKRLEHTPLFTVIIGDGPQQAEIQEAIRTLGLKRVHMAGFRQDINNAINALNAVVLASTWAEPCAAVVQQGMLLGKPVIGTNMGGTPEMIADSETGIVVPPNAPDAIARALQTLMDSPDICERMGKAGGERVRRLFTQGVMTDKIEALYQQEVAKRRSK